MVWNDSIYKAIEFDFKPYFSSYPFMARTPDGELDGNCILYAGHYGLLIHKLIGCYPIAKEHSAELYARAHLKKFPGLITRGPHKWEDPQTHDDYIGLCTLSFLGGGAAAKVIHSYGKEHGWVYFRGGNKKDLFNAQFWRLPGLVQHIKLCAGQRLHFFDQLWWTLGVLGNSFSKDCSGKLLKWHFVSVYEQSGKSYSLCDFAVRQWKRKLIATYPNSMGGIFGQYYEQTHPFYKWSQGVI